MDPITLLAFAFILGALIFIHESGHFCVAKALGIKVEVFSLGFGPKLLRFQKGGTEYCISALPLGGYVKMLGENPDESLRGSPDEFQSRTKFERFLVLVMGASLNIVLAVVLTSAIYMHGVPEALYLGSAPVIGGLDPNAAAAEAGLQVKDEIVAINGEATPTWRELQLAVALNPHKTLDFAIRREGELLHVPVTVGATEREQIGIIGIGPYTQLVLGEVDKGGPADAAGLVPGDILAEVDGQAVFGLSGYDVLLKRLTDAIGQPVPLTIEREGSRRTVQVVPVEKKTGEQTHGDIGVGITQPMGTRQYGPVEALVEGVKHNWDQASVLFLTLKKLITGQLSPRTLSGPIDIYRLTGESLRGGLIYYVSFMALVSLQLGIINLLPIPILDGGHIFILLVEGLIRRDLSMKIKERVMQFGFILLLLIMGSVLYMDVYKNFFLSNR
jgi:regulator of sigma E protease